jgi:rSAM/selenodomain-associated transferase 2
MISVVIPTLNAQAELGATLSALVPAAVDGLVRQVVISDGGSTDDTARIAEAAGAEFISGSGGRGVQLRLGAEAARCPWLLFLHADTALEPGWEREAVGFMQRANEGAARARAGYFRFRLDDRGAMPRLLEKMVAFRCALFRLPYGDQGLLIPRALYDEIGGFSPIPLMEDVDLIRRLGRRRLSMLDANAVTSPRRYRSDGYLPRIARNLYCLALYYFKVPPAEIVKRYG